MLNSTIWGSVAFKIKSPNFSILSAACKFIYTVSTVQARPRAELAAVYNQRAKHTKAADKDHIHVQPSKGNRRWYRITGPLCQLEGEALLITKSTSWMIIRFQLTNLQPLLQAEGRMADLEGQLEL